MKEKLQSRVSNDPRLCKTLGEAAQNEDGSWNGIRALSWMSSALDPKGRGISVEEISQDWKKAQEKVRAYEGSTTLMVKTTKVVREQAEYTSWGVTRLVPVSVYVNGKQVDTCGPWEDTLWVERGEDWYAFDNTDLKNKRVRVIKREDWLRSPLVLLSPAKPTREAP